MSLSFRQLCLNYIPMLALDKILGVNISPANFFRQLSVFYHFAGLVPRSMELDVFLRRLVKQLNLVEVGHFLDTCLNVCNDYN